MGNKGIESAPQPETTADDNASGASRTPGFGRLVEGWWRAPVKGCRRKAAWQLEDALLIAERDRIYSSHPNIGVYECKWCRMYHVGHLNNRHKRVYGCPKCHNIIAKRHYEKHLLKCDGYSPIKRPHYYKQELDKVGLHSSLNNDSGVQRDTMPNEPSKVKED